MKPTLFLLLLLISCSKVDQNPEVPESKLISFGLPQKVSVLDYEDDLMEPFLTRDGNTLFFNNSNAPAVNTNLHYALKINDTTFQYQGELQGVNTEHLEGVPTMDTAQVVYFVSTRSYDQTFSSLYKGKYADGNLSEVQLVEGISKEKPGWVNFDVEVTKEGNTLYFVDGRFDANGGPYEADFVLGEKINGLFQRNADQSIFGNINTDALEYAACISSDGLELYFTRVATPLTPASSPQIFVATRNALHESFYKPYPIEVISGFVEAPTISPNDSLLYYHKKEHGKFVLFMVQKE